MGISLFDTIFGFRNTTESKAVNQQNFTMSAINAGYRNPTWVARYPIADVSYPDALNNLFILFGTSGPASAGTAHTHALNDGVNNYAGTPAWALTQNQSGGSYITISNTTIMDTVGVHGRKTTATTINNLFLEVFQEYPDLSLVRIASIDISAQATTSFAYIEDALPTPIIAQAGERYMVRVRNSSTVATTFSLVGSYEVVFTEAIGFNTTTSTDSNKTTYTTSEATTFANAALACYWVMLANKNVTLPVASYSDDFNRSALGSEWVTSGAGGALTITNSEAAYGGTTDGDELGLYIRRTTMNAARVEGNLHLTPAASTQRLGLLLHANRDLSQYVYLSVTNTDAKIYSYTSATLTQRATVAVGGEALYSLTYDAVNDKYVALQDGAAFGLEWTGVSTAVTHDANYRFGGIRISRGSGINAGTIDNWTLRDYA